MPVEVLTTADLDPLLARLTALEKRVGALEQPTPQPQPPPPSPTGTVRTVQPGESLQAAANYLADGDTLQIVGGTRTQAECLHIWQSNVKVVGVPGPSGEPAVLSGANAKTAPTLQTGLIGFGVVTVAPKAGTQTVPTHVSISNLTATGGSSEEAKFLGPDGQPRAWDQDAAGIYLYWFDSVLVDSCRIAKNANGLFASGNQRNLNLVVNNNTFEGNGRTGSDRCHSSYCEVGGTTYGANRYLRHRPGSGGGHLKDRGAVSLITANRFEGASRQVDLSVAESTQAWMPLRTDYVNTRVQGNTFVLGPGDGIQVMFMEGRQDSLGAMQSVDFVNNTVVSVRDYDGNWPAVIVAGNWEQATTQFTSGQTGYTPPATLRLAKNVFYVNPLTPGKYSNDFYFFKAGNQVSLTDVNLLPSWWMPSYLRPSGTTITGVGNVKTAGVNGSMPDPGFVSPATGDYRLRPDSAYVGLGA